MTLKEAADDIRSAHVFKDEGTLALLRLAQIQMISGGDIDQTLANLDVHQRESDKRIKQAIANAEANGYKIIQ